MTLKKYIPDLVTSMNLVCGLIGVTFAIRSRLDWAFYCMLAAAAFDFMDGFVARALDAVSDLGRELDSLCDVVSFGVLPGLMLSQLGSMLRFDSGWFDYFPLLFAVFAALRLAKFNVDARQSDGFLGLPVPAAAIFCGALCCHCCHTPLGFLSAWAAGPVFIPLLTVALCALMVSEIPMYSFKFHRGDGRALVIKRAGLLSFGLILAAYCLLSRRHGSLAVMLLFLYYILDNLVCAVFKL